MLKTRNLSFNLQLNFDNKINYSEKQKTWNLHCHYIILAHKVYSLQKTLLTVLRAISCCGSKKMQYSDVQKNLCSQQNAPKSCSSKMCAHCAACTNPITNGNMSSSFKHVLHSLFLKKLHLKGYLPFTSPPTLEKYNSNVHF